MSDWDGLPLTILGAVRKVPECAAITQRRDLTAGIRAAAKWPPIGTVMEGDTGSQAQLDHWFSVLHGIVAEYRDGGDQMTEECTCGRHRG